MLKIDRLLLFILAVGRRLRVPVAVAVFAHVQRLHLEHVRDEGGMLVLFDKLVVVDGRHVLGEVPGALGHQPQALFHHVGELARDDLPDQQRILRDVLLAVSIAFFVLLCCRVVWLLVVFGTTVWWWRVTKTFTTFHLYKFTVYKCRGG